MTFMCDGRELITYSRCFCMVGVIKFFLEGTPPSFVSLCFFVQNVSKDFFLSSFAFSITSLGNFNEISFISSNVIRSLNLNLFRVKLSVKFERG